MPVIAVGCQGEKRLLHLFLLSLAEKNSEISGRGELSGSVTFPALEMFVILKPSATGGSFSSVGRMLA